MTKQVYLAGTSFYDLKLFRALQEFEPGLALILEREPTNQYDPNAVVVLVDTSALKASQFPVGELPAQDRYKLGHLPAKDGTAGTVAPLMDAGAVVTAKFVKHSSTGGLLVELDWRAAANDQPEAAQ